MVERDVTGTRKGGDLILESCFGVLDAGCNSLTRVEDFVMRHGMDIGMITFKIMLL